MLVLSAPSGAGKTTLANLLLKVDKHLHTSISYTTRQPREGEVHGKHYFFVDEQTFLRMIKEGEFLEYVEVFGHYYGTPKTLVEKHMQNGEDIVFDIDWQGNRSLTPNGKTRCGERFYTTSIQKRVARKTYKAC
jgi:guanylate kinase